MDTPIALFSGFQALFYFIEIYQTFAIYKEVKKTLEKCCSLLHNIPLDFSVPTSKKVLEEFFKIKFYDPNAKFSVDPGN